MDILLHQWQIDLYPLRVLYAPTLRLRYRVVWEREARQFNRNLGVSVFREPELAETAPNMAPGTVYIEDLEDNGLEPRVLISSRDGKSYAATVWLPVNEKDCESCSAVVKEAISLLFENRNL